jgi:transcriptional regulator with XRE-family HTH domain
MPVPPTQPERSCQSCGAKLSRYNSDPLCWPCQEERRAKPAEAQAMTTPLPTLTPSNRSAFTLRSILATARRTKPLRLSDVGQVLKHYRSIHQLTQRDLAALLGFDQSYISRLENGRGLRDIATLKHIAQCLGVPGQWLGLLSEGSPSAQSASLIEVSPSIIRLSQTARESGRADAAVSELWPLVLRLETQSTQDSENPPLLLTLASAQAMLSVILGDLLPEEQLWISVQFFKQAAGLVEEHGDARLQAEVYRGCGNELRKHKQYAEAISYLERAFSLSPDGLSRGIAAALLARTYGEMGDKEHFLEAMGTVRSAQERAASFSPTFNPVTTREVQIRGLLNVGEIGALPSLLEQDPSRSLPVPVAPQWHVISRITEAEALLRIGKVDDGLAHLKTALLGAELCSLPHQVQRAMRAVQVVEAYHPARALGDEARTLLGKLSRSTIQLPSPK